MKVATFAPPSLRAGIIAALMAGALATDGVAQTNGTARGAPPSKTATKAAATKTATKKPVVTPAKKPAAKQTWSTVEGPARLNVAIQDAITGITKSGRWGAMVVSLTKGDTLYKNDADVLVAPASTMKMYTSAIVLERFGPDHVFKTPVLGDGALDSSGVFRGSLYLRGVGDPSLSMRFWKGDTPLDALARQIVAAGVRQIQGDVVADASAFDGQLVPSGWKTSYLGAAYAARVSALTLNEGLLWVAVRANGKIAEVALDPPSSTVPISNTVRVVAGRGGSITASRTTDGTIVVKGTIGASAPERRYSIVADNPPLYLAGALYSALQKAGVTITGSALLGATPETAVQMAAVASPPLGQIVGEMNRESINVVAEMLFRAAAATPAQQGSATSALAALRTLMTDKAGLPGTVVNVFDGSGLSELDRVTPRSMIHLLSYAHTSPWSASFHASLPVEGESGTLRNRAKGTPARGNLHAKTGTTNNVASLGGYVTAKNGEIIAFSLVYNGADRWNAKLAMDRIGATLADWVR
jgi:D-alanyl-D-alanine carboxypeptidase/D-alanyl-D-alanine-endopeptidase (penicillin-binding protein 4)